MPRWIVDWTPGDGGFYDTYNVYLRQKTGMWDLLGSTAGNRWTVDVPDVLDIYEIGVAPVVNGIETDEYRWAIREFVPSSLADIDDPGVVANFAVEQIDQSFDARARWTPVEGVHIDGYEIREGAAWETAIVRAVVSATADVNVNGGLETTFGILAPRSTTFLIRARSIHGRYSTADASVTVVFQTPRNYKAETVKDEHGDGFVGMHSNTEVSGGDLRLAAAPTAASGWTDAANTYTWPAGWPHKSSGTYTTEIIEAQDDASVGIVADEVIALDLVGAKVSSTWSASRWRWPVRPEFSDGAHTIRTTPDTPGLLAGVTAGGAVIGGRDLGVEIRTTEDDPAGTPTWSSWRPFIPGARYRYRGVQLRITFTSAWTWVWKLTTFTITRYRLNLKDEVLTVDSVGSGGHAVTFTAPFTKVPVVEVTVDGTSAAYATVDTVTRTGCNIRIWDDGTPAAQITGTAHVFAAGV